MPQGSFWHQTSEATQRVSWVLRHNKAFCDEETPLFSSVSTGVLRFEPNTSCSLNKCLRVSYTTGPTPLFSILEPRGWK